ncbi:S-layer homology domain-containing protein [Halobacillus litoralis]|uniref:S-layer homology domain-containing protein n=1 Tax=Halobacillus litoralis TaxID=45668 RepID=UPI00273DC9EB|nr:S-layer homology domain-containing protein [Halobacillus litoralis]WLR49068.1 S-layer homology domain-containing protein [Halobacillus litoralis]
MFFKKGKIERVLVLAILALIVSLGNSEVSYAGSDVTPPVLNDLTVSKKEATVGDEVTITADVIDDLSGVDRVSIKYEAPEGTATKYVTLRLNAATSKYEGSLEIGDYDVAGAWKIDYLYVKDVQDNYYYYYNSDGGYEYKRETSEYIDLSPYNIVVSGTEEDKQPPKLDNLQVTPLDVTKRDIVKISAEVSDNLSGVDRVSIKYEAPEGTATKYVTLRLNAETGKYEGSLEIGDYDVAGAWKIDYLYVKDAQDNYYYYYNSYGGAEYKRETSEYIDLSPYNIVVSGTEEDKQPPKLDNLQVTPTNVKRGEVVKFSAQVSDNLSGVDRVSIKYEAPEGTATKYVTLRLNAETGKYEGSLEIGDYDVAGAWKIDYLYVKDAQDNYYYYYNSYGGAEYKRETSEYIDLSSHDVVVEETDKIAPITSVDFTSSTPMKNGWYPSNVTATLSATDEEAGIKKIEYRTNEGNWIEYTEAFEISQEGEVQLDYRSVDHAGNIEEIQTEIIKIDKTSPVTTTSEIPSGWGNEEIELSLTARDESSGVSSIEYRMNEGEWTAYDTPITIDEEGKHVIEYRSTDQAGNQEEIQTVDVNLDFGSPETTMSSVSDVWHKSNVEVTLSSSDGLSGVSRTEYRVNEEEWATYDTSILVEGEGSNKVEFRSIDHAGNVEATQSKVIKVDKTAPVTTAEEVPTDWSNQDVELTLSSSDELSGVSSIEYKINDGEWKDYSDPIKLDQEGSTTIEFRSSDNVGNIEEVQNETIKLDKTAPVTSVNGVPEKWANKTTEITLTSKDQWSGVATIEYRMNEGEWTEYSGPITFQQKGENVIDYRSVDTAGNVEEFKSLTVKYDDHAPQTSASDVGNQWHNSEVEVSLSSTDPLSGVAKTEYRINKGEWKEYTTPVLIDEEGSHTVDYRSIDYAGNKEEDKSITIMLDTTAPDTAMSTEKRDGDLEVTLSSSDVLSGVSKTEYRINQGEWKEYNSVIQLSEEGTHTVDYRSIDYAGNVEVIQSTELTIDKPSNDGTFKDIKGHWAEDKINYLVQNNLLSGYKDGTFQPDVNITRAEAATVISRELELEKIGSDFTDVSEDHWASGYIGAAAKANILSGYKDGTFHPDENLSRAEMATIVSRAYQLQGQTDIFSDTKGHWADSYIQTLAANNITVGYPDGTFKPEQEITRAEFASFVARVLEDSFRVTD